MLLVSVWLTLGLSPTVCATDFGPTPGPGPAVGEALRYDVEVGGVYVGAWEAKVMAGRDGRAPSYRAQLRVEPLLAPFLPRLARMLVQPGNFQAGGLWGRMQIEGAARQDDVTWTFGERLRQVEVRATHRGVERAFTADDPGGIFDPLSAFYSLRLVGNRPAVCLSVATPSAVWQLSLRRLADEDHKTAVGYRPSRSYALEYRPKKPSPSPSVRVGGFTGRLWQAVGDTPVVYEVVLDGDARTRATLRQYEKGADSAASRGPASGASGR